MNLIFLCLFLLYTCLPTEGFRPDGVAFEPATIVIPEHMLSGSGTKSLRLHEVTLSPSSAADFEGYNDCGRDGGETEAGKWRE
ncbi:hypothetical protein BDD12DRAFT_895707 [Trichophaea hybrida]|nr:hypothetical protein BDD12DRAFT_895707 [Trichophaea hybrida]